MSKPIISMVIGFIKRIDYFKVNQPDEIRRFGIREIRRLPKFGID